MVMCMRVVVARRFGTRAQWMLTPEGSAFARALSASWFQDRYWSESARNYIGSARSWSRSLRVAAIFEARRVRERRFSDV